MTINLENITTYGELREALPRTGSRKTPNIQDLRKTAKLILDRQTERGTIGIYSNGFFTYKECGRTTVYGVDRCERPETYAYSGKKEEMPGDVDFSGYPWELILECAGAARLTHNAYRRDDRLSDFSLDAPASRNNLAFSVRPEHELREEAEEEAEEAARRAVMLKVMRKGLRMLLPHQRKILELRYAEGLSFEEIGKLMGIKKGAACASCERAMKKVRENIAAYCSLKEIEL